MTRTTASTSVPVRYAETDQMGIVHHSVYVIWCELGRTELIKKLGFRYNELEKQGYLSPVTGINLQYKKSSVYDETVTIQTWVKDYSGVRIEYGYRISNEKGETCVEGSSEHVCVLKDSFRPLSIKKHLPEWHEMYTREVSH